MLIIEMSQIAQKVILKLIIIEIDSMFNLIKHAINSLNFIYKF